MDFLLLQFVGKKICKNSLVVATTKLQIYTHFHFNASISLPSYIFTPRAQDDSYGIWTMHFDGATDKYDC
jgi:hypothetical protein